MTYDAFHCREGDLLFPVLTLKTPLAFPRTTSSASVSFPRYLPVSLGNTHLSKHAQCSIVVSTPPTIVGSRAVGANHVTVGQPLRTLYSPCEDWRFRTQLHASRFLHLRAEFSTVQRPYSVRLAFQQHSLDSESVQSALRRINNPPIVLRKTRAIVFSGASLSYWTILKSCQSQTQTSSTRQLHTSRHFLSTAVQQPLNIQSGHPWHSTPCASEGHSPSP